MTSQKMPRMPSEVKLTTTLYYSVNANYNTYTGAAVASLGRRRSCHKLSKHSLAADLARPLLGVSSCLVVDETGRSCLCDLAIPTTKQESSLEILCVPLTSSVGGAEYCVRACHTSRRRKRVMCRMLANPCHDGSRPAPLAALGD